MTAGLGRAAAAAGLSGVSMSALMSQLALLPEDSGWDAATLPSGARDVNGQQLDLRSTNSWLLKLDQVGNPAEMGWCLARLWPPSARITNARPISRNPEIQRSTQLRVAAGSATSQRLHNSSPHQAEEEPAKPPHPNRDERRNRQHCITICS
jgi:hypothetical protein